MTMAARALRYSRDIISKGRTDVQIIPRLNLENDNCQLGDQEYHVSCGNWAFYMPDIRLKLLHSVDGAQHCRHSSAPSRKKALSGADFPTRAEYSPSDWKAAFEKTVLERTAENIICAQRLYREGLGPAVLGYCVVKDFRPWYSEPTFTAGYFVENIRRKFPKRKATLNDLSRAGIIPDRIGSCLREQIRGYVSDLNSVVGVMPVDAQDDVAKVREKLEQAIAR